MVTNQWPFFWILNEEWKAISIPELWQRVINVLLGKSKSGGIYSELKQKGWLFYESQLFLENTSFKNTISLKVTIQGS